VTLSIVGSATDAARLAASLKAPLARLGLTLQQPAADGQPALARVSVDLSASPPTVVVTDGNSGRVLERRELGAGGSDEVHVQEASLIIEATLEAALEAPEPAAPPPPPQGATSAASAAASVSSPASQPPPGGAGARKEPRGSEAASTRKRFDVGTFFGVSSFAPETGAALGGGLAVALGAPELPARPSVWLLGQIHAPLDVRGPLVDLRVKTGSVRLLPSVGLLAGPAGELDLGAGVGLSFVQVDATTRAPGARVDDERLRPALLVSAMLAGRLRIADNVGALLAVVGDVDTSSRRFVVARGPERDELLAPSRVRGALLLGLSFSLAGGVAPAAGAQPR
jgi:hypothetical protein